MIALAAALALAGHIDAIAGTTPFVVDGELVGGGSTWGPIRIDDDGVGRRVCEEAIGETARFFHRASDGRVLAGTSQGLLVTVDDGCTWSVAALDGATTAALALHPNDATRLVVATATPAGGNGLHASSDEGATWSLLHAASGAELVTTVVVGADGAIAAAGRDPTSGAPFLWTAAADGGTFVVGAPWPSAADGGTGATLARALGFDGEGVVVGLQRDDGRGALATTTVAQDAWVERAVFDGLPTAWASVGAAPAVAELVAVDGLVLHRGDGAAFTAVPDAPAKCLTRVPGDDRLWACGGLRDGAHFLATMDGVEWEPHLPFGLVVERVCPDGTAGATQCAYLYGDDAGTRVDGGAARDGGVVDEPPPTVCGCGAQGAAVVLFAAWRAPRRRRR